jgi:hypothetical protein
MYIPWRLSPARHLDPRFCAIANPLSSDPLSSIQASCFSADEEAAARAYYELHGWVHIRSFLSATEVDELQAAADALERTASSLEMSASVDGVYCEVQSASGRKGEAAVYPGALRKLTRPSSSSQAFASLRSHTRLLALLTSVCGLTAPRCVTDQLSCKPAKVGTGFPWHQVRAPSAPRLVPPRFDPCSGSRRAAVDL